MTAPRSTLKTKYEKVMGDQLDNLDALADGKPIWPAKERVALLAEVREYLAGQQGQTKMGQGLKGDD